jgi:hypothetical protein
MYLSKSMFLKYIKKCMTLDSFRYSKYYNVIRCERMCIRAMFPCLSWKSTRRVIVAWCLHLLATIVSIYYRCLDFPRSIGSIYFSWINLARSTSVGSIWYYHRDLLQSATTIQICSSWLDRFASVGSIYYGHLNPLFASAFICYYHLALLLHAHSCATSFVRSICSVQSQSAIAHAFTYNWVWFPPAIRHVTWFNLMIRPIWPAIWKFGVGTLPCYYIVLRN